MHVKPILIRFKRFCSRVSAEDTIALLYDIDPDGMCSAAIVARAIHRLRGREIDIVFHQGHSDPYLSAATVHDLKIAKIELLISVDKPLEGNIETLKSVEKFSELLIFDHHLYKNDPSTERCLWIKPDSFSEVNMSQYPTSRMVYDLFYPCVDIRDTDWLMAVGTIADSAYTQWKFSIDETLKQHQIAIPENIYVSELGKITNIITATCIVAPKDIDPLMHALITARGPQEILDSPFKEHYETFHHEMNTWMEHAQERATIDEKRQVLFYFITPKYGIRSPLSTIISKTAYKNWLCIICEELEDHDTIGISIRDQSGRFNCVTLIQEAILGFEGANGGGHIPAVGGKIKKKDYTEFCKRITELVHKHVP